MRYSFREILPYYRRNLRVAMPVVLTQLGAALVGLFDSIMVGQYATTDLAAVSFSNAIFFTVMVFSMGAVMGITPLVGFTHGELEKAKGEEANGEWQKANEQIKSYMTNGLVFTALICLVSFVLLAPCIGLLDYFGQEPEVVACARPYYTLIVLSILPFLLFCFCKQFLEGLGNTLVAMVITVVCNLMNILMNWILIYGHCGFPAMGAEGAGIGSLIARTLMPICFFLVMAWRKDWRQYLRGIRLSMIRREVVGRLFKIGTPIGMQSFCEAFLFTASFIIIGWINKETLAAHHIANQMADLTFMLALGIGAATTIRVSHQLGHGDLHAVRMASRASVHLCLMMNTIGAAIMILGRNIIPYIFTSDPEVVPIASTLLVIAGTLQYVDGLQCIGAAMLRGIQDVRVPMRIAVVAYIIVALPLGLLLTFPVGWGAQGMWISFVIALAIPAVLYHIRFHKQLKRLEYGTKTSV
ncbi:MAG: MATE family efflux transporter [Paludibacteraceae bacterium]|nr:MATE family efflux transporter [Paludibacteraceae bacterium]